MTSEQSRTGQNSCWNFLDEGLRSGEYNMQRDEFLARQLLDSTGVPTVRLYGWKPSAISVGYHQRLDDIDEARCREEGVDLVRRPTGGRAIFHADEITYCVTMYSEGKNAAEVYSAISAALARGLRKLGAKVEFAASQFPTFQLRGQPRSVPCFASSARYEIQYEGKKLVGSAQRRYFFSTRNDVVLQHGSILVGPAHKRLSEFLRLENEIVRTDIVKMMDLKTTDLASILARRVDAREIVLALRQGFEEAWGIQFQNDDHPAELREVEMLRGAHRAVGSQYLPIER